MNNEGKVSSKDFSDTENKEHRAVSAYMQTMEKHAAVLQSTASTLLSVCALTNGAFFAAFITYLSTPIGQEILKAKRVDCDHAMVALAVGFGLSCALMAAVIHYCNVKFSHYRKLLKAEDSADGSGFFQGIAIVLITLLVIATFYGVVQITNLIIDGVPAK